MKNEDKTSNFMKTFLAAACSLLSLVSMAQTPASAPADTVVIELARTSKVVFTIKDRSDIKLLKQYDFQALFQDVLLRLEKRDTVKQPTADSSRATEPEPVVTQQEWRDEDWGDEDRNDDWNNAKRRKYRYRGDRHSFNFDLGTNNFLSEGEFPGGDEAYAVRPWGSWYVGINSVQRTQITNKFFLEWGLGISWYNFKFEDASARLSKDAAGVIFTTEDEPGISYKKSKLTISYINASLVPMIDFGGYRRKTRIWESHGSSFRIGVGPYVGYRIGSHTKVVYKDDGDREKDKDRDNFHLNNLRYGVRLQLGIRSTDLFFNYDLNKLFNTNKSANPDLNAISFGVIF
jgi:hypothetical protein